MIAKEKNLSILSEREWASIGGVVPMTGSVSLKDRREGNHSSLLPRTDGREWLGFNFFSIFSFILDVNNQHNN